MYSFFFFFFCCGYLCFLITQTCKKMANYKSLRESIQIGSTRQGSTQKLLLCDSVIAAILNSENSSIQKLLEASRILLSLAKFFLDEKSSIFDVQLTIQHLKIINAVAFKMNSTTIKFPYAFNHHCKDDQIPGATDNFQKLIPWFFCVQELIQLEKAVNVQTSHELSKQIEILIIQNMALVICSTFEPDSEDAKKRRSKTKNKNKHRRRRRRRKKIHIEEEEEAEEEGKEAEEEVQQQSKMLSLSAPDVIGLYASVIPKHGPEKIKHLLVVLPLYIHWRDLSYESPIHTLKIINLAQDLWNRHVGASGGSLHKLKKGHDWESWNQNLHSYSITTQSNIQCVYPYMNVDNLKPFKIQSILEQLEPLCWERPGLPLTLKQFLQTSQFEDSPPRVVISIL